MSRDYNLKCVHCYASADADPLTNELGFDEGCGLLRQLRDYRIPAVPYFGGGQFS